MKPINFAPLNSASISAQKGFTLIEVMIVVAILGVLATLVVVNISGSQDTANVNATKSNLQAVSQALDLYKLDNYRYPTTDQGLQALVEKPDNARNWPNGGYLKKMPADAWDQEFIYLSPGTDGPYDLFSLGADGAEGGEGPAADISVNDL
ncbi:MAG: type II secretion system protein GspG [Pseudomonadales bacterium]|nr:type II secretion system protein GspG [Pseudomonadales bacterium]RLU03221.1 MAG: type II secretion system protein GspG [Ketobacter sp.]